MRSLKSLLGSALLQDKTAAPAVDQATRTSSACSCGMLAQKAQADLGGMPGRVVMAARCILVDGRPCARPAG